MKCLETKYRVCPLIKYFVTPSLRKYSNIDRMLRHKVNLLFNISGA